MKTKEFTEYSDQVHFERVTVDSQINDFIQGKRVIDIKYAVVRLSRHDEIVSRALVMYEG